jgi:hypothetical protein
MPPRLLRVAWLCIAAPVLLSCREEAVPTGPASPQLQAVERNDGLPLCSPLPPDSVTKTLGPKGGVLGVGPHRLWVLPGSLKTPVTITAIAPTDTINRIQFRPEGLKFAKHVVLLMSYTNCSVRGAKRPRHVAYTDDGLQILEYLEPVRPPHKFRRWIAGRLQHFSNYALAW